MPEALTVTAGDALAVVVTTVGVTVVLMVLLRLFGQRSVARLSTFDVVVLLVLGSAGGRVLTGYTPTLAAGVIAITTLFALRWVTDHLARTRIGALVIRDRPILLARQHEILPDNLRRARVSEEHLWEALRGAGIRNLTEIGAVVLEPTGSISVIRAGATVDERLLRNVRAERPR